MCISKIPGGFFNPNPMKNIPAATKLAVDATKIGQNAANKATKFGVDGARRATQIGMSAQRAVWHSGMQPATPTVLGGTLKV